MRPPAPESAGRQRLCFGTRKIGGYGVPDPHFEFIPVPGRIRSPGGPTPTLPPRKATGNRTGCLVFAVKSKRPQAASTKQSETERQKLPFRSETSVCRISLSGSEVNDPGWLFRDNHQKALIPCSVLPRAAPAGAGGNISSAQLALAVESTTQRLVLEMGLLSSMETTSPTLYWFTSSCAW